MSYCCCRIGLAGLAQTAARGPPSACRTCRTLHRCMAPATGSQWLRVLVQLPTPGAGAPLWDSGIPLRTLRSSPTRPQLVLGVLAAVPGAPTLVAKRLASGSAFDKASYPDCADTDEMAHQPYRTLEEAEVDPSVPTLSQVSANLVELYRSDCASLQLWQVSSSSEDFGHDVIVRHPPTHFHRRLLEASAPPTCRILRCTSRVVRRLCGGGWTCELDSRRPNGCWKGPSEQCRPRQFTQRTPIGKTISSLATMHTS